MIESIGLQNVDALANAITTLFSPYVEVSLHDLTTGQIVEIWNPISGRKPGDDSLIEAEFHESASKTGVMGPFEQTGMAGQHITSVSVPVSGGSHLVFINFDRTVIENAAALLGMFAVPIAAQPEPLFAKDWKVKINQVIAAWTRERNLVLQQLTRAQRHELVRQLEEQGLFETRNAAEHVAASLGVSRATVYKLRA